MIYLFAVVHLYIRPLCKSQLHRLAISPLRLLLKLLPCHSMPIFDAATPLIAPGHGGHGTNRILKSLVVPSSLFPAILLLQCWSQVIEALLNEKKSTVCKGLFASWIDLRVATSQCGARFLSMPWITSSDLAGVFQKGQRRLQKHTTKHV